MPERRPVILDVDTGVDDALALALAVLSPEVEPLAVTTLAGNTGVENATRNTLDVLSWLGREDVPVHRGASRPLCRAARDASYFHGRNGLGNVELPRSEATVGPDRGPAAIIRHAQARPGEVTLVAVGPLTNVAIALNVCPELVDLLDRLVVMGGAFGRGGNVTPHAEYNIWADPEAAKQVFDAPFRDATVVGLDVTELVSLSRDTWRRTFGRSGAAGLVDRVCRQSFVERKQTGFFLHDPMALGVGFDPSLTETVPARVEVTPTGEEEGKTVNAGDDAGHPGWRQATRPDADRFVALVEERLGLR